MAEDGRALLQTSRGATLAVQRYGAATRSPGRAHMIWCHGLGGCMHNDDVERIWDFWNRGAAAGGALASITRYDNRGHGDSSDHTEVDLYTWEGVALDMAAVAEAELVEGARLVVGGASMGAGGSLWLATTQPQRVAALILVIPPTCYETRKERAATLAALAEMTYEQYTSTKRPKVRPIFETTSRGEEEETPTPKPKKKVGVRKASFGAVFGGSARADFPPRETITANVTMPTLILGWDIGDTTHPASSVHELKRLIPHAEAHIAKGSKDCESWVGLIADFVERLPILSKQ